MSAGPKPCPSCGAEFDPHAPVAVKAAEPWAAPALAHPAELPAPPAPAPRAEAPARPPRFTVEEAPGELRIGWRWFRADAGPGEDFALYLCAALMLALMGGVWLTPLPHWMAAAVGLLFSLPTYILFAHRVGRTQVVVRGRTVEVRYGPLPFPDFTRTRRIEAPTEVRVTESGFPRGRPEEPEHWVWLMSETDQQPIASFAEKGHALWLKASLERRLGLGGR